MSVQIVRIAAPPDQGWTMGRMFAGAFTFWTLELPWRNNAPRISCIPTGFYRIVIAWSNRYARLMPRILGVPDRTGILVHPGNTAHDTAGCVLVGNLPGDDGKILHSIEAFTTFFGWLGVESRNGPVPLEIMGEEGRQA